LAGRANEGDPSFVDKEMDEKKNGLDDRNSDDNSSTQSGRSPDGGTIAGLWYLDDWEG
jgi:hypothetical protein